MEYLKNIQDDNIICAYLYGSHVYGTNHQDSDIDFVCILKNKTTSTVLEKYGDVTSYTLEEFQKIISNHEITALECIFLPDRFKLIENHVFTFEPNKQILRNAISAKASNSWVKCKKKLTEEKDFNPYIGKKSAWHALRILDFGTQIATHGRIVDYSSMNHVLPEIMKCDTWEDVDKRFRKFHNEITSNFKLVAPK